MTLGCSFEMTLGCSFEMTIGCSLEMTPGCSLADLHTRRVHLKEVTEPYQVGQDGLAPYDDDHQLSVALLVLKIVDSSWELPHCTS